jgi:nucleoside-diphosphate-sugar epimerase
MNNKVAVTGANGFIGQAIIKELRIRGFNVLALVHRMPLEKIKGIEYKLFELGKDIEELNDYEIDKLIHLAFEFKKSDRLEDQNILTAKKLKSLNISQFIFISSFAVNPPITDSYYGRCKSKMEYYFKDDLIIRPGLVLGNGGLFGKIFTQLKKNKILPLINGGNQLIYTIHIEDLIKAIIIGVENSSKGIWNVAHNTPVSYKELILMISTKLKIKPILIPLPIFLIRGIIWLLKIINKPLITRDNLNGLLTPKVVNTKIDMININENWKDTKTSISII